MIEVVITAVLGAGGVVGLFFYFFRRYIEKRLEAMEQRKEKRVKERQELLQLEDRLQHCYGRLFFWIHRAIVTGTHNGELQRAFEDLQSAEEEKKDFDRRILAVHQQEE